ncbi:MAG: M20/M25/M40 family metallo-hydrolase [Sediminispirochaetaceae bacterium]
MNRDASLFAEAEKLLGDLVAFPSLSRHENTGIIEYVETYLQRYGAHTTRISIAEKRWNLFATIGPRRDGGLCLSGHLDVVPADKQGWNHQPFTLTRKSDRYYGRGTTDMKGYLALVLALVPVWAADKAESSGRMSSGTAGKSSEGAEPSAPAAPSAPAIQPSTAAPSATPAQPIHIALTYDEEDGCSGAPALIRELGSTLPKPEAVIVGEPTGMVPVIGHRAGTSCFTEVRGLSSHSSNPEAGINAIYTAADLIRHLRDVYNRFAANPREDSDFSPAYSTISVGTITGGTARNVIPDYCGFEWEIRSLPGENPNDTLTELEEYGRSALMPFRNGRRTGTGIHTTIRSSYPALEPDPRSKALEWVRKAGCTAAPAVVNFGTEAGLYQQAGIPAVVWGPGNIKQAHTNDEFIMKNQLTAFLAYLRNL